MELTTILFYLFSIVTLGSAAVMVLSRNIVHSAFALMFTLMGVAALYVLLYADFLAATQILVYVGGILILILFGIMLTSQGMTFSFKTVTVNFIPAILLSGATAILLTGVFWKTNWNVIEPVERTETVYEMGMMLMGEYMLPFITVGVLLLVAIIGAILMATKIESSSSES